MSFFTAVVARHARGWRVLDLDVDDAEDLDELAELVRGGLPGGGPGLAIIEREDSWFALVRVDEEGEPRPFVSDLGQSLRSRYGALLEVAADVDVPAELDDLVEAESVVDSAVSAATTSSAYAADRVADAFVAGADDDGGVDEDADDDGGVDEDADDELLEGDEPPDELVSPGGPANGRRRGGRPVLGADITSVADLDEVSPPTRTWAGDPTLLDDLGLSAAELVEIAAAESDDPAAALAEIGAAVGFEDQLDLLR